MYVTRTGSYTPVRTVRLRTLTPKAGEDEGRHEHSFRCRGYNMVQPLGETVWRFLAKLNVVSAYDPAGTFLSIYPNRELASKQKHAHTC